MEDLGEPIAYLALEKGVPVFDARGEEVGRVDHVLADQDADVFDGVVVDTSPLPGGRRFADADQIDELHERGVVLRVDGDALHEPPENPAVVRADPDDTVESPLQARLRRAWDYLSGRY
jgi:uncharacterized protein YrrD